MGEEVSYREEGWKEEGEVLILLGEYESTDHAVNFLRPSRYHRVVHDIIATCH